MDLQSIVKNIHGQARQLNACDLFKGDEDLQGLVRLFTSPQGLEFCMRNHFPNTATFRLFKPYAVEKYGIYIDAGNITLENPRRAVLIGRTSATVNCDTNERHEVVVLSGAKALVNASRWAVVFTRAGAGCSCIKNTSGNAIIL